MIQALLIAVIYATGVAVALWMMRVEMESEGEKITNGQQAISHLLSVLSWLMVLITLVIAWVNTIKKTGYWNKPIKDEHSKDNNQ